MTDVGEGEPLSPPAGEEDARAEGTGETVGEAKWAALRELERRYPGIDKASVRFEVLSEGERGILGVGYAPARVVAELTEGAAPATPPPPSAPPEAPGSPEARLREILERVCAGLGVRASVSITATDESLAARLSGPDLGLLIGKHGQTIDAIQYLASALLWREEGERKEVVVDAAGYRARRRAALERLAEEAVRDVLRTGERVVLEPMTASERKIVHLHLQRRPDVETASEGADPNRCVVVAPAALEPGDAASE
jgi:spoIIIJ-associated protein